MARLLQFAGDMFTLGVSLASDAIDSWTTGESRQSILEKLRTAVERSSELVLENARLRDEIDELRFNGPTLYSDEVEALKFAAMGCDPVTSNSIRSLLKRCDHMPMTAAELNEQIDGIISGAVKLYPWGDDDPGKDIDDDEYEGSWREAADNEGARLASESNDE